MASDSTDSTLQGGPRRSPVVPLCGVCKASAPCRSHLPVDSPALTRTSASPCTPASAPLPQSEILSIRVKCVECDAPPSAPPPPPSDGGCAGMNLCLSCLATGREDRAHAPKHSRSHRYRVVDNLASMHLFEREFFLAAARALASGGNVAAASPTSPPD